MVGQKITNKTSVKPLSLCICQSCKSTSHDTFQLLCEHCICKTCISNTSGDSITCTQCQRSTTKNSITLCSHPHPHGPLIINCESNQADFNPSLICEFCSKQFTSNIRLDEHKQKECNKITQPCPLVDYGCLSSVRRVELAEHYLSDVHQNTIITVVRRLSMKPTNDQSERASTMDVDIAPGTAGSTAATTTTIETLSTGMVEVYEAINTLASSKEALDASIRRISSESVRLQSSVESLIQGLASLKSSVEEQSTFIEGVKPNQDMLQQEVASLKQKVDDAQYVSYDGILIWKITNFQEKMRDAQSERQTSIYSPPFYSSLSGYKMCARLYLHGDGNARGTHMSLFFVLMRGPNDAVLKFPFNYKVTFCLYDQTPQQRHIIDSFRPDLKSNSFQRPRSEMNIAAGIPTFFPLAMIQQDGNPYVRDDTMFIKIMVDFRGMDGSLLPYTLSLNPGLPMHIQQLLIKREEERRNEQ